MYGVQIVVRESALLNIKSTSIDRTILHFTCGIAVVERFAYRGLVLSWCPHYNSMAKVVSQAASTAHDVLSAKLDKDKGYQMMFMLN